MDNYYYINRIQITLLIFSIIKHYKENSVYGLNFCVDKNNNHIQATEILMGRK